MNQSQLFTTPQAAKFLNVSQSFLAKRRLIGGGPIFLRMGGERAGAVRYRQEDLEVWLQSCARTSTSDPGPDQEAA